MYQLPTLGRLFTLAILCTTAGCSGGDPAPEVAPSHVETVEEKVTPEAQSPLSIRQEIAPNYTPGEPLTVKATMNYTGSDPVTALALRTTLPAGWQYAGIQG